MEFLTTKQAGNRSMKKWNGLLLRSMCKKLELVPVTFHFLKVERITFQFQFQFTVEILIFSLATLARNQFFNAKTQTENDHQIIMISNDKFANNSVKF